MKKVSTTTAKQSRNISQQKRTIGLNLGDRNSWYCVLDEVGQRSVLTKPWGNNAQYDFAVEYEGGFARVQVISTARELKNNVLSVKCAGRTAATWEIRLISWPLMGSLKTCGTSSRPREYCANRGSCCIPGTRGANTGHTERLGIC